MKNLHRRRMSLSKSCGYRMKSSLDCAGPDSSVTAPLPVAESVRVGATAWRPLAALGFAALALSLSAASHPAEAQEESGKAKASNVAQSTPPLPPTRPAGLPTVMPPATAPANPQGAQSPANTQNPPGAQSSPAVQQDTSTKEPSSRASSSGDSPSNLSPYQARALPPASRIRMHECGAEWQQMKATGAAGEKTWYSFAQTCLTR
jgi:hypothetical protein